VTISTERWLLDTNIWLFGLRRDETFPECAKLLSLIGLFSVVIPRQVLKELTTNFTEEEASSFHQLVNDFPEFVELSWDTIPIESVKFYEQGGCRKGDAIIAAHPERLNADLIVTENRQFLQMVVELKVKILTPADALKLLSFRLDQ